MLDMHAQYSIAQIYSTYISYNAMTSAQDPPKHNDIKVRSRLWFSSCTFFVRVMFAVIYPRRLYSCAIDVPSTPIQ